MSKFGIDVSHHNGNIIWDSVKPQIDFAILKLGNTGDNNKFWLDESFETYYSECKRLNIPVGVYLYCYTNSVENAKEAARQVAEYLKSKTLELPVFLDMEDKEIKVEGKNKLTEITIAFNTEIENNGFRAGVYANRDWFDNYLNKEELKTRYATWIATYCAGTNKYEGEYDMWQNSSKGKINGIFGYVDTNYMYTDLIAQNSNTEEPGDNKKGSEEIPMFRFKNGKTVEPIYADTDHTIKIGSLNKWEECDCFGIFNGAPMVRYEVGNTGNYKVGFAVDVRCVK